MSEQHPTPEEVRERLRRFREESAIQAASLADEARGLHDSFRNLLARVSHPSRRAPNQVLQKLEEEKAKLAVEVAKLEQEVGKSRDDIAAELAISKRKTATRLRQERRERRERPSDV
jgi:hypothetical protein